MVWRWRRRQLLRASRGSSSAQLRPLPSCGYFVCVASRVRSQARFTVWPGPSDFFGTSAASQSLSRQGTMDFLVRRGTGPGRPPGTGPTYPRSVFINILGTLQGVSVRCDRLLMHCLASPWEKYLHLLCCLRRGKIYSMSIFLFQIANKVHGKVASHTNAELSCSRRCTILLNVACCQRILSDWGSGLYSPTNLPRFH